MLMYSNLHNASNRRTLGGSLHREGKKVLHHSEYKHLTSRQTNNRHILGDSLHREDKKVLHHSEYKHRTSRQPNNRRILKDILHQEDKGLHHRTSMHSISLYQHICNNIKDRLQ